MEGITVMETEAEAPPEPRYSQAEMHDIRRAAEWWWTLLSVYNLVGLSESERALLNAVASIMARVRQDGLNMYHLVDPQLGLWSENDPRR